MNAFKIINSMTPKSDHKWCETTHIWLITASHLSLHPLQATTFITSHFGSTQESFCLWSSAQLLITRRFLNFQYDGRPIKKIDCIRTVQVIGDLYVCWCWFLRKGKIVRVLDVRLCLWVIWVAGSSLHYSWLEALILKKTLQVFKSMLLSLRNTKMCCIPSLLVLF